MRVISRPRRLALSICTLLAIGGAAAPVTALASECGVAAEGGDWPSAGHDLANSRSQPLEDRITADSVGALAPVWSADIGALTGEPGSQSFSVPVVAGGCVF